MTLCSKCQTSITDIMDLIFTLASIKIRSIGPNLDTSINTITDLLKAGASTQGGISARCTMAKIGGGNVVMIMMLLLVSVIIYYYMNTFITLHQCTFNLLSALFSTLCLKKTSPMF